MAEESMSGLEDLMLGNASEGVSESDEKIAARAAAAAAKIKQIKKDEQQSRTFDAQLARVIRDLDDGQLEFVIFLIQHGIPSLTILALMALAVNEAGKVCYEAFEEQLSQAIEPLPVTLDHKKAQEKVALWLTFMVLADEASKTTKLAEFHGDKKFISRVSQSLAQMLETYLKSLKEMDFKVRELEGILNHYEDRLFRQTSGEKKSKKDDASTDQEES